MPLELDKQYTKSLSKLEKLQGKTFTSLASIFDANTDDETPEEAEQENMMIEMLPENLEVTELKKLKKTINQQIIIRRNNPSNTSPVPAAVRRNHNLMAVYCEGQIVNELIVKTGNIMPDGTSRQGVGEIAATVNKIRTLKSIAITKGTGENWASVVVYMLDRLATASSSTIENIWKSISSILSDLCKVNRNLYLEIQKMIEAAWKPGQLLYNLHSTLAVPEGIKAVMTEHKAVMTEHQSCIGGAKLFPKTVGFEMNLEGSLIFIQILDCWMQLTSIRWQARAWNKYKSFTDFAEKRGIRNVGHMLHTNRFGEFEERCAGALYLSDIWVEWLDTFVDVRNQLAYYLREVKQLIDQCKFLWCGAALVGVHVTIPFMSMLLDHRVTPWKLLTILPALYQELKSYPESFCKINSCAIPSLKIYFANPLSKETSLYGIEVSKSIQSYLEEVDHELMDLYLR